MRSTILHGAAVVAILSVWAAVPAQVITVDTSEDVTDFGGARTVADLPGPDGRVSLKEAAVASDNTPGIQTIAFDVPQSEWQYQWLHPGRVVFTPFLGIRFNDTVIVDGTTQTASTGDTNPDGAEVVIWNTASIEDLYLNDSVGGEIRGLDGTDIQLSGGSENFVRGNTRVNVTVFDSDGNVIGGPAAGDGNEGGTIKIDRADDNVVVGNTVQRVRVLGFGSSQPASNNRIGGPMPEDRNFITGYGTINGEGLPGGTTVQLASTVGTVVENNRIGTTPDGMSQGSLASTVGIGLEGFNSDTVLRDNRIAGILGHGQGPHHAGELYGWAILVGGEGAGLTIVGNTIGLDAADGATLGSVWGIDVGNVTTSPSTVSDITIGEGNVVAGHRFNGITIGHDVDQVRISGTTAYDNGWLGIDLIPSGFGYGATPNDTLDEDAGGNGLQNFPDIASVEIGSGWVRIVGALHSAAASEYRLEFFASPVCDDSGFGEGREFLGASTVFTDGAGDASFDVTLGSVVESGARVTATATLEPIGRTSEFGACVTAEGAADPGVEPITDLRFVAVDAMDWASAPSASVYDVMRGDLSLLRLNEGVGDAICGWEDHPMNSLVESEDPDPGSGFYYVLRGDAATLTAGTLDNPPGMSMPTEGRDAEVGTGGGSSCGDLP